MVLGTSLPPTLLQVSISNAVGGTTQYSTGTSAFEPGRGTHERGADVSTGGADVGPTVVGATVGIVVGAEVES
jgi:hypothetical protein